MLSETIEEVLIGMPSDRHIKDKGRHTFSLVLLDRSDNCVGAVFFLSGTLSFEK